MKSVAQARWAVLALALFPLMVMSCSSGGGGGDDGQPWSLAGTWNYSITITDDPCAFGENESGSAEVTQSGSSVTITLDGVVHSGSYSGSSLPVSAEEAILPTCTMRYQTTLTIESDNRMTGSGQATFSGNCMGAENCTVGYAVELTR